MHAHASTNALLIVLSRTIVHDNRAFLHDAWVDFSTVQYECHFRERRSWFLESHTRMEWRLPDLFIALLWVEWARVSRNPTPTPDVEAQMNANTVDCMTGPCALRLPGNQGCHHMARDWSQAQERAEPRCHSKGGTVSHGWEPDGCAWKRTVAGVYGTWHFPFEALREVPFCVTTNPLTVRMLDHSPLALTPISWVD